VSDDEDVVERLRGLTRRQFLAGAFGTLTAVGAVKAAHNTILGYGELGMGSNLRDQALAPLATQHLHLTYDDRIGNADVRTAGGGLDIVQSGETHRLDFEDDGVSDAQALDDDLGLDGRLTALFADAVAFRSEEYTFEFSQPSAFFERVAGAEQRSETVGAVRGRWDGKVDADDIEAFTGVDPANTDALTRGLMEALRAETDYDIARYLAGSVEDNVIFGSHDLRQYFEEEVDFQSLTEQDDDTGIFCYELVYRSMEAMHSVAPADQTVPVATCYVSDLWHKHAYTGVVSAIRDGGELIFPMTFVDYTYSTLYDDLHLTGVRGDGLAAYDEHHRADEMFW
jgi:hypothetical protein